MQKHQGVSISVIKRLPRYYRYLTELLNNGIHRISSRELASMMALTASQIRQDLSCFGGFGQQGYGYNVSVLQGEIANILGLNSGVPIVLIGTGNLGRAIATYIDFPARGFKLLGLFDRNPELVGQTLGKLRVQSADNLEAFCKRNRPQAAILCIPKEEAQVLVEQLLSWGITAFWNFSHYDIKVNHKDAIVENVHLGDSLMTLCYQINNREEPSLPEENSL